MSENSKIRFRALPAAVFVPTQTLKKIVNRIAKLSEEIREKAQVILVRTGRYRASTDQVVLYHHDSKLPPLKADLIEVVVCKVSEIDDDKRNLIGAPLDNKQFLGFMRNYWDESLEMDSSVTMIICCNLRGDLVESFVEMNKFLNTLPQFSQE